MTPRHHLSDPEFISRTLIFRDFAHFLKSGPVSQGFPSRYSYGTCTIGKSVKIIRVHLRDLSFDELGPEISWVKGGPGHQTGGWGLGQSGAPCRPGGECFAPLGPEIS